MANIIKKKKNKVIIADIVPNMGKKLDIGLFQIR